MEPAVTLQFQSLDDLWAFRIDALIYFIEMNQAQITLTCKCSQQHLQLAVSKYKAEVLITLNNDVAD